MFATRLKELRNNKHLTQAKLAELMGVSQQAVGLWERSKNMPSHEIVDKLASLFDVTVDYLLGRSDHPHGEPFAGQRGKNSLDFADQPPAPAGQSGKQSLGSAEGAVYMGVATGIVKTGRKTIQAEPLTPEELSLLQAYRNASDRDKSIVDAVLKPSPPPKQHSPVCKDLERNKWIQSINNMYDSYYPLIDKLDYYSDFVHNQEEFSCLLEHPKMRELFEAAVTNQELRDRVPDNRGKKDNIAEALADVMVTEFDTFQADYMVPPEGETYLLNKLKELIP